MIEMLRVPPTTLREQALTQLRALLVTGALKPGEVYSATAIAAELGVSHGPVREAMLTLVNDGMMEVARSRGFRVVTISKQDRENIAELRTLLEVPSMVKLAGSPLVAEHAATFDALIARFFAAAEQEDIAEFFDTDREFHLGLLSLLQNDRLTEVVGTLRDQTRQYGIYELAVRGELLDSAQDHRDLLDALLAGDAAAVESLMHAHLQYLSWSRWTAPDLGGPGTAGAEHHAHASADTR